MFLFESNLSDSVTQVGTYKGQYKSKERLDLPHNVAKDPLLSHAIGELRQLFIALLFDFERCVKMKTPTIIRYAFGQTQTCNKLVMEFKI